MDLSLATWLEDVKPVEAIRLHPRRAARPLDPTTSKMGWPFLWPANEPWPVCMERGSEEDARKYEAMLEGMPAIRDRLMKVGAEAVGLQLPDFLAHIGVSQNELIQSQQQRREETLQLIEQTRRGHRTPYLPVLQLNRDQFPGLPFPGDTDLFQLLWCPLVHFGAGTGKEAPGHLLFWRRAASITEALASPPSASESQSITACSLDPERIRDYPDRIEMETLTIDEIFSRSDDAAEKDGELGAAPGTKLFGFPKWIQDPHYPRCPRCRRTMTLLVTVSSSELGFGTDVSRWAPLEEWDELLGAPYSRRQEYDLPHSFMIGDVGNAYLFYCRKCVGHFSSQVECS
jgi:hypothetical protein